VTGTTVGAQQLHAVDVDRLALDVDRAHVDDALEPEPRRDRRGATPCWPAPVSAMMRRLPMSRASSAWPHGVVDLVRAGVVEVLALEQDLRAADLARQALGEVDRRRTADVVLEVVRELVLERRVALAALVRLGELRERRHQRLGHETAAVRAEVAGGVG
jgi:hypothetical protein